MIWTVGMNSSQRLYEVRPRKDHRGVDLISDVLPFGRAVVWRTERDQQHNRIRGALQPFRRCRDY